MNQVFVEYAFAPEFTTSIGPNWSTVPTCCTFPAITNAGAFELNVAPVIAVKPFTVMVTFAPDAAVAGAVIVGAPSTVIEVDAVSIGVLTPAEPMVTCNVYSPGVTLGGTTNFAVANRPGNEPVSPTVTEAVDVITELTNVDPWYSAAEIGAVLTGLRMLLGVKPVPESLTPIAIGVPAITLEEPSVIAGVFRIVRVVVAELPAASVTLITSAVEVSVDGTTKPTGTEVYKSPVAFVVTDVPAGSVVAGVVPTFSQVVAVSLTVNVCMEFAAKPVPVIATCAPGLTAANPPSFGWTVNVAVA